MTTETKTKHQDTAASNAPASSSNEAAKRAFTGTRSTATHQVNQQDVAGAGVATSQHKIGILVIANVEAVVAAVMISTFLAQHEAARGTLIGTLANVTGPVILLIAGVTLGQRRLWGWWSTCSVLYFAALESMVTVVLGLSGVKGLSVGVGAAVFGACVGVLVYLCRESVMREFSTSEKTPSFLRSRISPATAGFGLALLFILFEIIGP